MCMVVCPYYKSGASRLITVSIAAMVISGHHVAGYVPTHFAAALVESPEERAKREAATMLGRLGTPEDMAAAVAYLASEDAAYVTAECLVIAGGMQSRL